MISNTHIDMQILIIHLCDLQDQMWRNQESGLCAYSIALLNCVSYNVVEFAKSQVSCGILIMYLIIIYCVSYNVVEFAKII